jgi:hypothetical protein
MLLVVLALIVAAPPAAPLELEPMRLRATVRFELDQLRITPADGFDHVQLAGCATPLAGPDVGQPALPIEAVRFVLPPGTRIIDARVEVRDRTVVPGAVLPLPLAPMADGSVGTPGNDTGGVAGLPAADPVTYSSEHPWPPRPVAGVMTGWWRGVAIGTVHIRPVEFIGSRSELRLCRELEVEITLGGAKGAEGSVCRRRAARVSRRWRDVERDWLRRHIVNDADIDRFTAAVPGAPFAAPSLLVDPVARPFAGFTPSERPSVDGPPVRYVIVTDSLAVDGQPVGDLVSEFQRLADWKTARGMPAVVRTVGWIRTHYAGHDDAARVRAFLVDAYEQWGTDFVLLGGDARVVPARRVTGVNLGLGHPPADAYFGGLDGDWDLDNDGNYGESTFDVEESDPYWDIWVGRAPVESRAEAAILVDKTLSYEHAPGVDLTGLDPSYHERMLLLAGLGNCATWGLGCNGLYVGEVMRRRLTPPGFTCTRLYQQLLDPSPSCLYHQTYLEVADSTQTEWTTPAALAALESGYGFIHHFEHSNPYQEGGASGGFGCSVTSGGAVGREYVDLLTNAPNWSIMLSTGAGVNAYDYDSVSKHWVLNPNGGCVAYIGKTRSGSTTGITGEVDTLTYGHIFQDAVTLGQALALGTQGVEFGVAQAVTTFDLLGDPELRPWTAVPGDLTLAVDPPLLAAGDTELRIEVRDASTQTPLDGAVVAIAQGATLYAYAATAADGQARFAVSLAAETELVITATARNHAPVQRAESVAAASGAHIVYVEHAVHDDSLAVANQNGVVDAGEVVALDVTAANRGQATASGVVATLQVIGAVTLSVLVDDTCEPDLVFIGTAGGQPPAGDGGACTLPFPALEFTGRSPVGVPVELASGDAAGLFIWREGATWHLVARGESGGVPVHTFDVRLAVAGGFGGVVAGGLESGDGDSWAVVAPDTLDVHFRTVAAGDADSLAVTADEPAWLAVVEPQANLGDLAPGGDAGARFIVALGNQVPDRHAPRLELAVQDVLETPIGRTSFELPVAAPVLEYARQAITIDGVIPEVAETIVPSVRNAGSGIAGQVEAVARLASGSGVVVDSVAVLGAIAPAAESAATGDPLAITTPDTSSCRLDVELVNTYPDGSTRSWLAGRRDVTRPCAPAGVSAEPWPSHGARIKWSSPPGGCAPDLAGFVVYRRPAGAGDAYLRVADTDSTRSAVELSIESATDWEYAVATRDASGNESTLTGPAAMRSTAPEHAGWPLRVSAGTASSPLAVDVDHDGQREILALGNALHGWRADGSPLLPGAADGVVFAPPRPPESFALGAAGAFLSSPAAADLDGDGTVEIVVAAWDDSLWVVHPDGELLWGRRCDPKYASPALGDLDGDGDLEIVIGSDQPRIYAWHHDGTPVNPSYPDGRFADLPDGAYINYGSVALADLDDEPSTVEIVYPTFKGTVYAWNGAAQPLWSCDVGPNRPLSTPAIGDVDDDGTLEIVVAQGNVASGAVANALYVIDGATGMIEQSWSGGNEIPGALFANGNFIHPPSLADLDDDGDLEIVVGSTGLTPEPPHYSLSGAATLLVFDHDGGGGYAAACTDTIPLPGLNMTNTSGEYVNAQPLLVDLDADGIWELTAGSATFGLFVLELDRTSGSCGKRPGWPVLFEGEVDATPWVGDLDGDGALDLIARSNGGDLHRLDLDVDAAVARVAWGQFAHDPRHTSNVTTPLVTATPPPGNAPPRLVLGLGQNVPNPFRTSLTRIDYSLPRRGHARLTIYAVDGRLVRTLVDGLRGAGGHTVDWDGRDPTGRPLPAGIYLYRLEAGGHSVTRKLVHLH